RTDLERCRRPPQALDEFRVFEAADAVTDALRSEDVNRLPHGRRTGRLAGVRNAMKARLPRQRERRRELRPRIHRLETGEPEADDTAQAVREDQLDCLDRGGRTATRARRDAPAEGDAARGLRLPPSVLEPGAQVCRGDPAPDVLNG